MRKMVIAGVAMLVLSLTALAYAQVSNTYKVSASTSPTKAGSKSKPVPVGVKFSYDVGEASGKRPSPVTSYSIRFAGLRANTSVPGTCSDAILDDPAQGADACPKDSIVGSGYIENATGAKDNPDDKSIPCNARLTVVNKGAGGKASIYVQGSPDATNPKEKCAIPLAAPIDAKFTNKATMSSLDFKVPDSLLHPAATLSNAVVHVDSTIKKITKNGKGFFESVGGCKGGKRNIEVVFTPEDGAKATGKSTAKCSK